MSGEGGTCPRCGRAGSVVDLGEGLWWCEDCNIGITDEDHLDEEADESLDRDLVWIITDLGSEDPDAVPADRLAR